MATPIEDQLALIKTMINPFRIKNENKCKNTSNSLFSVKLSLRGECMFLKDKVYQNIYFDSNGDPDFDFRVKIRLNVCKHDVGEGASWEFPTTYVNGWSPEINSIMVNDLLLNKHISFVYKNFACIHEAIIVYLLKNNENIILNINSIKSSYKKLDFKYLRDIDEIFFRNEFRSGIKTNEKGLFDGILLEKYIRSVLWDLLPERDIITIKNTPEYIISKAVYESFNEYNSYLENYAPVSNKGLSPLLKCNCVYKPFYKEIYLKLLLEL